LKSINSLQKGGKNEGGKGEEMGQERLRRALTALGDSRRRRLSLLHVARCQFGDIFAKIK